MTKKPEKPENVIDFIKEKTKKEENEFYKEIEEQVLDACDFANGVSDLYLDIYGEFENMVVDDNTYPGYIIITIKK